MTGTDDFEPLMFLGLTGRTHLLVLTGSGTGCALERRASFTVPSGEMVDAADFGTLCLVFCFTALLSGLT